MDQQIESAARIFEEVEKIRRGCDAKLSHLGKNRWCLDCGRDWMPKKFEPCPECGSKKTKLLKRRRKCQECEHVWQPSELGVCPWCGSSSSEPSPKDDPYIREVALPRLIGEEEFYEGQLQEMVNVHPAWPWAKQVPGAGLTTIGRIIGKTDITRVNTTSEMWAHCGFGLEKDENGVWGRQRKRAGQAINYDTQLQSNCVMLGESLTKAGVRKRCADCKSPISSSTVKCVCGRVYKKTKDQNVCPACGLDKTVPGCVSCGSKEIEDYAITGYGQYYLDQKEKWSHLGKGHCHNRSFRHTIKLFLSHFWQTWREAEGLPAPLPYVFDILKHPSGHMISPWEMVKKPAGVR